MVAAVSFTVISAMCVSKKMSLRRGAESRGVDGNEIRLRCNAHRGCCYEEKVIVSQFLLLLKPALDFPLTPGMPTDPGVTQKQHESRATQKVVRADRHSNCLLGS